jgi:hypothetical protein
VNQGNIFGGTLYSNYRCAIGGSSITNLGTIEARGGAIAFAGTFSRAGLGNLIWTSGGTFGISGTLMNEQQTFVIDTAHPWELDGGTIQGGTLQIQAGASLNIPLPYGSGYGGVLDGVTVNGRITHFGAGNLNIKNGLLSGNADVFLGSGALEAPSRMITSGANLTIGSTAFVHGGGRGESPLGSASGVGDGSSAVINNGTIKSEQGSYLAPEFDLLGTSIQNNGLLAVGTSSFVYVSGAGGAATTLSFGTNGALSVLQASVTPLQINGKLDLSGSSDLLSLSGGQLFVPFTIVTASDGIVGQFNSVTFGYLVAYKSTSITATMIQAPEPDATFAILGIAQAFRRRSRANR